MDYSPVVIEPRHGEPMRTLLHHRHDLGSPCGACEIVRLREEVEQLHTEIERIGHKLENGTLHVVYCNGDHTKRVGAEGMICNCPLGREIQKLRHERNLAIERFDNLQKAGEEVIIR